MNQKKSIIVLLSISLLLSVNLQAVYAQNLDALNDYSVKLAITPNHLEHVLGEHKVGYFFVLSKHGVPITSSYDVAVSVSSDDPSIVSVPPKIVLKANEEFVSFPLNVGEKTGKTTITATLNGKTTFQKIEVGTDKTYLPDELSLSLNIPTDEMHVNSEMPFSVFLKTPNNVLVRAPHDIEIKLEFEEQLGSTNSDFLTIEKGDYYTWGIFTAHEKTGNMFLRAIHEEPGLDVAKSIHISSTLPTALQLSIFPKMIPAEIDRKLDVFVTVVDSDGNPTKTPNDIPLEFFSSEQYLIGEKLSDYVKSQKPVIKKGEFGFLLQEKFSLQNLLENDILIGVTSEGYGTATDTFRTVGTPIEGINNIKRTVNSYVDFGFDVKDYQHTVNIFGLQNIPSNASSFFTYQLSIIDDDGVRPDGSTIEIHPDCADQSDDEGSGDPDNEITHNTDLEFESRILYSVDCMDDGMLYPVQSKDNQYSDGYVQQINVISSDEDLAQIENGGKIVSSYSFGTSQIHTGQKTGPLTISASVNGVGIGSFETNVVNPLEQKEVRLFSPTGEDSLIFDRDGFFDIFLVSLDGSERPKVMKESTKYLVTPTNSLVEIPKESTSAFAQLRSDTFDVSVEETSVSLVVEPIGEKANLELENTADFITQPSSKMQVTLPLQKINVNHENNFGVVQLVDLQGNPVLPKFDVKSKITSSEDLIVQILDDAIIPIGTSYATFPIKTTGSLGESLIHVSAKGVNGTSSYIDAASSQTQLQIFTSGLTDEVKADEPIEIRLFVDDENAESVPNASLKIVTADDALITPAEVRTSSDGSAIVSLTAFEGPSISFDIIATVEGYAEGKDSFTVNVDAPQQTFDAIDLGLPEWIIYIVIGGILMVGVVVFMFLKKSKSQIEEEWEEEEEL